MHTFPVFWTHMKITEQSKVVFLKWSFLPPEFLGLHAYKYVFMLILLTKYLILDPNRSFHMKTNAPFVSVTGLNYNINDIVIYL
jgi:hypothetical protein